MLFLNILHSYFKVNMYYLLLVEAVSMRMTNKYYPKGIIYTFSDFPGNKAYTNDTKCRFLCPCAEYKGYPFNP